MLFQVRRKGFQLHGDWDYVEPRLPNPPKGSQEESSGKDESPENNNVRQTDSSARTAKNDTDPDHHQSTREIQDLMPAGTSERDNNKEESDKQESIMRTNGPKPLLEGCLWCG